MGVFQVQNVAHEHQWCSSTPMVLQWCSSGALVNGAPVNGAPVVLQMQRYCSINNLTYKKMNLN